jgi:hypothetical protein
MTNKEIIIALVNECLKLRNSDLPKNAEEYAQHMDELTDEDKVGIYLKSLHEEIRKPIRKEIVAQNENLQSLLKEAEKSLKITPEGAEIVDIDLDDLIN